MKKIIFTLVFNLFSALMGFATFADDEADNLCAKSIKDYRDFRGVYTEFALMVYEQNFTILEYAQDKLKRANTYFRDSETKNDELLKQVSQNCSIVNTSKTDHDILKNLLADIFKNPLPQDNCLAVIRSYEDFQMTLTEFMLWVYRQDLSSQSQNILGRASYHLSSIHDKEIELLDLVNQNCLSPDISDEEYRIYRTYIHSFE